LQQPTIQATLKICCAIQTRCGIGAQPGLRAPGTASVYNLLSHAGRFGLSAEDARRKIDQIVAVVRQWRESFFACGVSVQDVDYIAPATLPERFFFEIRPNE